MKSHKNRAGKPAQRNQNSKNQTCQGLADYTRIKGVETFDLF